MSKKKQQPRKIDVSGGGSFEHQAFASFSFDGPLASSPTPEASDSAHAQPSMKKKTIGGRLDVKREKSGRAGKTVTVVYAFPGMDARMKKDILSVLKKRLATGGSIVNGNIEIQGDVPERVVEMLNQLGYKAVKAGG